ncbi:MAG: hypothetical protein ACRD24_12075 [Terriglobales bacterium]
MSAGAPITLRPMNTGELLDRTITLYRRHFFLFVGISAPPNLVVMAVTVGAVLTGPLLKEAGAASSLALGLSILILLPIVAVVYLLTYALAQAATTFAISEIYLGRVTTITQAYDRMKFRMFRLLLIWIVIAFAAAAGLLLCIIPGIWVILRTAVAVPAAVIEDLKTMPAIERSIALTKGSWVRVLLVYILVTVLNYAAAALFQFPFLIGAAVVGEETPTGIVLQVLAQFGASMTAIAITPLAAIALALIYYDERVRKEGFDLQYMMAALDTGSAPAPGAAPGTPPAPPPPQGPPPPAPIG